MVACTSTLEMGHNAPGRDGNSPPRMLSNYTLKNECSGKRVRLGWVCTEVMMELRDEENKAEGKR